VGCYRCPVPADDPNAIAESFQLASYVEVLGRRWRLIALVALVAVVGALALSLQQEKLYSAKADILISSRSTEGVASDTFAAYLQSINATRFLNNEVEALESGTTRDAVAEVYDGPLDPDDVTVNIKSTTADVATVSVRAPDPDDAAELVNLYVEIAGKVRRDELLKDLEEARTELQSAVSDLDGRIASIRQPLTDVEEQLADKPGDAVLEARRDDLTASLSTRLDPLEVQRSAYQRQLEDIEVSAGLAQTSGSRLLTAAKAPTTPVSPKPVQNALLALIVGGILGVVVAFVRDSLDERIRDASDLERAAPGLPVLTAVPEVRETQTSHVSVRDDSMSAAAEAYRSLRTSVKFASLDNPTRIIQVTSAVPGEGKTTTAANLAEAFAQGGERVALVGCDLRRPAVHHRFGSEVSPGLTNVLLGDESLAYAVNPIHDGLYLLPAGSLPPNPSELLSSSRTEAVIHSLAEEFDVVILDCTPILPVTDALAMSRIVDSTLLVVDIRTTKRKVVHQAIERLTQVSAPITGLVLIGVGNDAAFNYGYAYDYT
jgi:succinoglycan biosynthesis transport protein ExoP